jgi:hypothetical protein
MTGRLAEHLDLTEGYMRGENLRGYDPYDALCSPIFRLPVLRDTRLLRFGAQQVVKRLPVNVRPVLRIPKQLNPVTVALFLQALAHRAQAEGAANRPRRAEAVELVGELGRLVSPGWSGACWGYPFDWEARYASLPAGTPTIVATGMVTNALAVADDVFDLPAARALIVSAADFVLHDLHQTLGDGGSLCWSYSPRDRQVVLNATLKGSRLLAQAHARGADAAVLEPAARSAAFVVDHQDASGAWPYAIGDARKWADNFHTGYVLECLREYQRLSADESVVDALDRGWRYYRERFFTTDLTPKYYDDEPLPVDATACAQAIITLCAFGDAAAGRAAADRSLELLAAPDGSFAYQRRRRFTVRIPYLRWSTAWMYCALARLSMAGDTDR